MHKAGIWSPFWLLFCWYEADIPYLSGTLTLVHGRGTHQNDESIRQFPRSSYVASESQTKLVTNSVLVMLAQEDMTYLHLEN